MKVEGVASMTRRLFGKAGIGAVVWAAFRPERLVASDRVPALPFEMTVPVAPFFASRVFDIRKYGAASGGLTLNTQAIAAAIAACSEAGGGRVLVPAGVWLTGPIHLKSSVELHVGEGAELRFSQRFEDYLPPVFMQRGGVRCYNYSPLIYARHCNNIAVTGRGTLNGQGDVWWDKMMGGPGMTRLYKAGSKGVPVEQRIFVTESDGVRPPFIQPIECSNVLLEGFTVNSGPAWNIHPVYCENVTVRGVSVITHGPNNDGIDPEACRNVLIEDCLLDTGDDCICLKAGHDEDGWAVGKPCENVIIRRCQAKRGHGGVVFGSEMSAGIRNVFVHDCRFDGTDRGIRIKSKPGRGGYVENLYFQDITMDRIVGAAIHMTFRYGKTYSPNGKQPRFRNFQIRNVTCNSAKQAVVVEGLAENHIQDVLLEDVRITAKRGLSAEYVKRLRLNRVGLMVEAGPVMRLLDTQDVVISEGACPAGTDVFLKLEGATTREVRLIGTDLANARQPVEFGEGVSSGVVKR
jgi:polygalacturonase